MFESLRLRRKPRYIPRHADAKANKAPIAGFIGPATAYPNRSGAYPANPAHVPDWPTMRIELPPGKPRNGGPRPRR